MVALIKMDDFLKVVIILENLKNLCNPCFFISVDAVIAGSTGNEYQVIRLHRRHKNPATKKCSADLFACVIWAFLAILIFHMEIY
jgi:hypothetical protein